MFRNNMKKSKNEIQYEIFTNQLIAISLFPVVRRIKT